MTSVARSRTPAPSADKQIRSNDEVSDAIATGRPVVVMESTIYSSLGLPSPHNLEAYDRCTAAIRAAGAVPALSAVLGGECWVGTPDDELERILSITNKVSTRDLYVAVARGADGVTTVAASVTLAALAGVDVFATGGMGGVHRGSEISGDVSADLGALGREPVVTVTAGAKAFLDLPKTVEYLDTLGIPLLGYQIDEFPAFYSRTSGIPIPHRMDSAAEVAATVAAGRRLGYNGGFVVANAIPASAEIPAEELDDVIERALALAQQQGARGAEITPIVLGAIGEATEGRSIPANLALAESNATVAAQIAVAIASDT